MSSADIIIPYSITYFRTRASSLPPLRDVLDRGNTRNTAWQKTEGFSRDLKMNLRFSYLAGSSVSHSWRIFFPGNMSSHIFSRLCSPSDASRVSARRCVVFSGVPQHVHKSVSVWIIWSSSLRKVVCGSPFKPSVQTGMIWYHLKCTVKFLFYGWVKSAFCWVCALKNFIIYFLFSFCTYQVLI